MAFLPALSAVFSAVGGIITGMAALAQADYAQQVAEMNAKVAEQNAQDAVLRSQQEQIQVDDQARELLGRQVAAQSASGLSVGGRTQMLTRKSARKLAAQDRLNIREAGRREAFNYRVDKANFQAQGEMAKMEGRFNALGSFLGAGGSLLGAAQSTNFGSRFGPDPWLGLRRKTV